jgi:hypothetical protein
MMRILEKTAAAATLGVALLGTGSAWAIGGSFACKQSPTMEAVDHVEGGFGLQRIVIQYMTRWDAQEAMKQCRAYAQGQPYDISCLNGRRDWDAIIASVPEDYFGRSNESLAESVRAERRKGNGFTEAMAYCRSVGAIK